MNTEHIPTKRDSEPKEKRVIRDALYDMRATRGTGLEANKARGAIVRAAAESLGWSVGRVLDAITREAEISQ